MTTNEEFIKEMRRKLAWAVGSTLKLPYYSERTPARRWATRAAIMIVESHTGIPAEESTWGDPWESPGLDPALSD